MNTPRNILIIRFSSIGDIVLCTAGIRCLYKTFSGVQIDVLCSKQFHTVLQANPYISKIIYPQTSWSSTLIELKQKQYDLVIDWQSNLKSRVIAFYLNTKTIRFNKINFKKWLAVRFKEISLLPKKHIVQRYFESLKSIQVNYDEKGLDFFINPTDRIDISKIFSIDVPYAVLVLGGSYFTKRIPETKIKQILTHLPVPVILIGGKESLPLMKSLKDFSPKQISYTAHLNIHQSASVIQQSQWVFTSDTGMMHIAAAFKKIIFSFWGNTLPEFGMAPFEPHPDNLIFEVLNLDCRPCSKLGFHKCPRGHFKCMNDINLSPLNTIRFNQQ